jgi:hypothetical protein
MEVGLALGVVESAPLLAAGLRVVAVAVVFVPEGISNTSAIGLGLVAESAIITETRGAWLPAHGADTIVSLSALGIAEGTILLLALSAGSDDFADTAAVGVFPAV